MSAHTPGPWSWGDDYQGLFGSGPNNEVLTHYNYEGMHLSYGDKQDANARLIAAAPDMLDALRMAQTLKQVGGMLPGVRELIDAILEDVDAAIAKATGTAE